MLVPGGVTLPPTEGEDAGKVQTHRRALFARDDHAGEGGELGLPRVRFARRRLPVPRHGGDVAGRRRGARPVACRTRRSRRRVKPIWLDIAVQSARALMQLEARAGLKSQRTSSPTPASTNAMAVHAAFGGSTNLLLHIPAIAHAAGLRAADRRRLDRRQPPRAAPRRRAAQRPGPSSDGARLPRRRRARGDASTCAGSACSTLDVLTVTGRNARRGARRVGNVANAASASAPLLREQDGVDPDDVILPPGRARARGLTSTVDFPARQPRSRGLGRSRAPRSIRRSSTRDGVLSQGRPGARLHRASTTAIAAIKKGADPAGDILVLIGCGPIGTGMEETYQLTSALKYPCRSEKQVALMTDARFTGVSTGACIGHVGPEALAGGPIGKLRTATGFGS